MFPVKHDVLTEAELHEEWAEVMLLLLRRVQVWGRAVEPGDAVVCRHELAWDNVGIVLEANHAEARYVVWTLMGHVGVWTNMQVLNYGPVIQSP